MGSNIMNNRRACHMIINYNIINTCCSSDFNLNSYSIAIAIYFSLLYFS